MYLPSPPPASATSGHSHAVPCSPSQVLSSPFLLGQGHDNEAPCIFPTTTTTATSRPLLGLAGDYYAPSMLGAMGSGKRVRLPPKTVVVQHTAPTNHVASRLLAPSCELGDCSSLFSCY